MLRLHYIGRIVKLFVEYCYTGNSSRILPMTRRRDAAQNCLLGGEATGFANYYALVVVHADIRLDW